MASSTAPTTHPDMSHYPPELLASYLATVRQDAVAGVEEDEAMLTDPEIESEAGSEADGDISMDGDQDGCPEMPKGLHSLMRGSHIAPFEDAHTHALAIDSDDSGFSSEDEYTDDYTQWLQRVRKDLVLGRTSEILTLKQSKLVELWEGYVRQVNAADIELEELLATRGRGAGVTDLAASSSGGREHKELHGCMAKEKREVSMMDEYALVAGLIVLVRALFEREKKIKRFYGKPAMLG
jgi:hypothetical protein